MSRGLFYVGVFVVSATMLMMQIIHTRLLSVVTWYYSAFLLVSLAMFGLAAAAVFVHLRRERFAQESLPCDLTYFTNAAALLTVVSLLLELTFDSRATGVTLQQGVMIMGLAAPFFLAGISVCLFLTRSPFPVGRVYAADMAGAATGCLAALLLLDIVSGPASLLWTAAILALASLSFGIGAGAPSRRPRGRPFEAILLRPWAVAGALTGLALGASLAPGLVQPWLVKGTPDTARGTKIFEEWNSISRISVYDQGAGTPRLWGPSKDAPTDLAMPRRLTQIDGLAGTFSYELKRDLSSLSFLKHDVTNFAYHLPGVKKAAVIGVGGGRDVLSAKVFGVEDVVGLELNPILLRLALSEPGFSDFIGLKNQPGIRLINDEGRSWLATNNELFDVIQMSVIDTWAATGAGAFALAENRLYTVDGWKIFSRRLSPNGVLSISRYYEPGRIGETSRIVSNAMALLMERQVANPRDHIIMVANTNIAVPPAVDPVAISTLLVSNSPFAPETVRQLEEIAAARGFTVLVSPSGAPADPVLRALLDVSSSKDLRALTASLPLDISPSTDERPFFFNLLRISDAVKLLLSGMRNHEVQVDGNLAATSGLLGVFLMSLLLVATTILVPLRATVRRVEPALIAGGTLYFAAIGVGFMAVEVGLLQRMSVFLGHPVYSLSIVLFGLILSSALGSFACDRFPLDSFTKRAVWAGATGLYLLALPYWLPEITGNYVHLPLVMRAVVCVAVIMPAGILMGYALPTGIGIVQTISAQPIQWFWGINGAAGVLTASLAVACSIEFGINVTLWIGGASYLMLVPAMALLAAVQIASRSDRHGLASPLMPEQKQGTPAVEASLQRP